jgi:hypothetical protein
MAPGLTEPIRQEQVMKRRTILLALGATATLAAPARAELKAMWVGVNGATCAT